MRLNEVTRLCIVESCKRGINAMRKPVPQSLHTWATENFYLSPESSYVEGKFEAFPFQPAIMNVISNDDVRDVYFLKSARVGCTKIMLAAVGYFAHHKRRNQAIWQPVDDDADEFVKTEIDPMIRDVQCMREIFPWYESRHKNNTMRQKAFIGSSLHIRGGKAAKNYRRISVDTAYIDELDGFDRDIEMEGDPVELAKKRVEGAVFPKFIAGSTPKVKGKSQIEPLFDGADIKLYYFVPCIHCDEMIQIEWGGKDVDFGFKWEKGKPETVAHLCKHCGALMTQDEYLDIWERGIWKAEDGRYVDNDGLFYNEDGELIPAPRTVGFRIWTAYSPMTDWSVIVRDFEKAKHDPMKLKGFVNLTLGETWEEDAGKKMNEHALAERCEHYDAEVPDDVLMLTIGADTQDDRVEVGVKGWGSGEESWWIDHYVHYGDPSERSFWDTLLALVKRTYSKADGTQMDVSLMCIDSGGHFTDEVYEFCRKAGRTFAIPTKGSSVSGKPIAMFPKTANKHGVYLTMVGTDTVKDLSFHRLENETPGPGYIHFPVADWCHDGFFSQLTAEFRKAKYDKRGILTYDWHCPKGRRNEIWDIENLNLVAIRLLQQQRHIDLDVLAEMHRNQVPMPSGPMVVKRRRMISEGIDL